MKDIFCYDFRDSIRRVVRRELKEKFGIKPNKDKTKFQSTPETTNSSKVFGVQLTNVPSRRVSKEEVCSIPIFLIDAFEYLNNHLKVEGLFRKSGSLVRQKTLRELLEKGGTCCDCEFIQAHDVASLIKQFFRELPDPLLTARLTPTFLKCASISNTNDCISALALCCLLLPDVHLHVLKYFVQFISGVANHSFESKMTLSNLAIVFAPNLVALSGKEKLINETMLIVDLLLKNSHLIGMVPEVLLDKAKNINTDDGGFLSSSGDELDVDDNLKRGRTLQRTDKKRDRSRSITGFLRRNFKQGEKSTPKHSRSRTCEKQFREKQAPESEVIVKEFGDPVWKNSSERPVKRRNTSKTNMSPVRKSPRILQKERGSMNGPVISLPVVKSLPNQIVSTPHRLIQPIQNGNDRNIGEGPHLLPSKFSLPLTNNAKQCIQHKPKKMLSRSQSSVLNRSHTTSDVTSPEENGNVTEISITIDDVNNGTTITTHKKLPQPKISRATQKPHVRKTRRTSSLDRRRARYASSHQQLPKHSNGKIMSSTSDCSSINSSQTLNNEAELAFLKLDEQSTENEKEIADKTVRNRRIVLHTVESNAEQIDKTSLDQSPHETPKMRHLPKSESFTLYKVPRKENTITTRNSSKISRSSTIIGKPSTPYPLTPKVGATRSKPVSPIML